MPENVELHLSLKCKQLWLLNITRHVQYGAEKSVRFEIRLLNFKYLLTFQSTTSNINQILKIE